MSDFMSKSKLTQVLSYQIKVR